MSSPLLFPAGYTFLTNSGAPVAGGSLGTYVAGTTPGTPQATYSDDGLSILNPNPIPLDSAGRLSVSGTEVNCYPIAASYKLILFDAFGAQIWSHDFVDPAAPFNILSFLNGVTITNATINTSTLVAPTINTSVSSTTALFAEVCQGRLTLTSGLPVTTADVTGATSILFSPYGGNTIGLFDGVSKWSVLPFAELSVSLGTLTSGLPYDVFIFSNAGSPTLRAPVAWTNTTTRATALVTQNGILVKSGATTDRYLGTFYTTATTTTEDSAAKRFVWNYYNRVSRFLNVNDTTNSWTYTTATWRQARAQTTNQVEIVVGFAEDALHANVGAAVSNDTNAAVNVGIGLDSTSAPASAATVNTLLIVAGMANANLFIGASMNTIPTVGYHKIVWLEASQAVGTTTWGGAGSSTPGAGNSFGSGINALWKA
jgi:hypothetical protein